MGGESFLKMVWPKTLKVYIWCAFGVASNGKSVKCWCGNSEVGVEAATQAIRRAPPMRTSIVSLKECREFVSSPACAAASRSVAFIGDVLYQYVVS